MASRRHGQVRYRLPWQSEDPITFAFEPLDTADRSGLFTGYEPSICDIPQPGAAIEEMDALRLTNGAAWRSARSRAHTVLELIKQRLPADALLDDVAAELDEMAEACAKAGASAAVYELRSLEQSCEAR